MTRRWLIGMLLGACVAAPAHAAGKVAVIPATIGKGDPRNAGVVTQAIRKALQDQGFTLSSEASVNTALRNNAVNRDKIIPIAALSKIRTATDADYVVYPRVLAVGTGINAPSQFQATIIVNVVGESKSSFLHTRQIGAPFASNAREASRAVIGRADALDAAAQLLKGFFAKAK